LQGEQLSIPYSIVYNNNLHNIFPGVFNKEKASPAVSAELRKNTKLQELLTELQEKLNISPNSSLNTSKLFSSVIIDCFISFFMVYKKYYMIFFSFLQLMTITHQQYLMMKIPIQQPTT
jgi:hypothetical protein